MHNKLLVLVDNLLIEHTNTSRPLNNFQPHLGLLSLIASVRAVGYRATLFDPNLVVFQEQLALDANLYRTLANRLINLQPDVLGFTALGCNFICVCKVASYVKSEKPDLPIILGGPHATILHEAILKKFQCFDIVVRHEAEIQLPKLLDHISDHDFCISQREINSFENIDGIAFRNGNEVTATRAVSPIPDLDTLPWPSYDAYPIEDLQLSSLRVEAGRGCPYSCTFCSTASFFGRSYRVKSPKRLCAELDHLHGRYGIREFSLTHDLFTVNRRKVIAFCEEVLPKNYTWSCSARMDRVDKELLSIMTEAGCSAIYYGIETGSERMQKITQKRQDIGMFNSVLSTTISAGAKPTVSFITGYPQERQEDQNATLDLLGSCFSRIGQDFMMQLHLLTPEPGTTLNNEYAHELKYDGVISDFNFPTLEEDDKEWMKSDPVLFPNHHYYPTRLPRTRHVFASSIFQIIYELGLPLACHLIDLHGGKLSYLVDCMYQRWSLDGIKPQARMESLLDYVRNTYGDSHYITSLVRYTEAARQLSNKISAETRVAERCSDQETTQNRVQPSHLKLNSNATILTDLHNCVALLDVLNRRPMNGVQLPEKLAGKRESYLIQVDLNNSDQVTHFEIEKAMGQWLSTMINPVPISKAKQTFRTTISTFDKFDETVHQLTRRSIIHKTTGVK